MQKRAWGSIVSQSSKLVRKNGSAQVIIALFLFQRFGAT
jgi:hypothetical protein